MKKVLPPVEKELQKGKNYAWCRCGLSAQSPFCDGSHQEAGKHKPLLFHVEESGRVWLCCCRRTKTPPFCDGSHKPRQG